MPETETTPSLRELAESALDAISNAQNFIFFCPQQVIDDRDFAVRALFSAINAQEATLRRVREDAELGRTIRAVIAQDGEIGLFHAQGNLFLAGTLEGMAPSVYEKADTLDAAVAAWLSSGKDGPQ